MYILIDVDKKAVPSFSDVHVKVVNSNDVHILDGDDNRAKVRAEYLYSECRAFEVDLVVVEDQAVAEELLKMGVYCVTIV